MRELGFEPRSQRWQRRILTTILLAQQAINKRISISLLKVSKNETHPINQIIKKYTKNFINQS